MKASLRIASLAFWAASISPFSSATTIPLQQAQPALNCNRTCLETHLSTYLSALIAHDPTLLPTTPSVKYVENDQILPFTPSTGIWSLASTLGTYRHIFSDPSTGNVAAFTTILENGIGAIYIVRLKVDADGKLSEIETQITRDPTGAARYEKLGKPEDVWVQAVPIEERISRELLISQTNKYYSGLYEVGRWAADDECKDGRSVWAFK
ncbi:hypothetical protein G7Y89_g13041 [Cudoniella acicularis]|uniref:Uncharacterized protein n=1 Tax=Cudoniella acicularis TaxID=354080 RepID=A0A8H4RA23_9HELO|nr:hypothetical protein G7Y89_g13041 [Cudoniella acicularis]